MKPEQAKREQDFGPELETLNEASIEILKSMLNAKVPDDAGQVELSEDEVL